MNKMVTYKERQGRLQMQRSGGKLIHMLPRINSIIPSSNHWGTPIELKKSYLSFRT